MKVFALNSHAPEPKLIHEIAALLKAGGAIAYPTDTLYGLGADAFNSEATHRISMLKGRDGSKPFPYIIDKPGRLTDWHIHVNPVAIAIMREFWPGPVSLILRDSGSLPAHVLGAGKSICVRVPDSEIARAIAGALGGMVVATSANPAGCAPARNAKEAMKYFRGEIDAVVDGGRSSQVLPSTVVDVTGSETVIVREGAISADRVRTLVAGIQNES